MYLRPVFAETDITRIIALIRDNPFGLFITHGASGLAATHIPFALTRTEQGLSLAGHLASANPQCAEIEAGAPALAVFSGPHAYVAPGWYVTQPAVPTWDYAAVHVTGRLTAPATQEEADDTLRSLAAGDPKGFDMDRMPVDFRAKMIAGIRSFVLVPDKIEAQWKLSQNRSPEDRAGVIAGLRGQGDAAAAAVADLIEHTLPGLPSR